MNESFGGGFNQQGGEDKQENKTEGTLPVLIKEVLLQKEDICKMWGLEYKMITLVALVRNIEHASTKITYSLEDFTGSINAHLWVEEGDAPSSAAIMLGTYARIVGSVRQQGDMKSIIIYKIQPVKGVNEVNTHYFEAINARYQSEEYYRGGIPMKSENGSTVKMETTANYDDVNSSQAGPQGKELVIFNAIQESGRIHSDVGISRQELCRKFPHISEKEMTSLLTNMSSDGHIYTSIDHDHFLSCH
ncbi:CLUMA_CG000783, isoform A [Clunio marinus]|uniref:CLUMA_CG000783, isoform A n=1 Tax=Clunio marinus TaxID=568069 RepID=A0A1J1HG43_9DIPT|nr:CLUMA_CG000783, isoform A [Clunio marinus]